MANKWMRKLGLGMSVIMTVSQMSGMMVFAAPESDEDGAGDWEASAENLGDESEFTDIFEDKFETESEEEYEEDYEEECESVDDVMPEQEVSDETDDKELEGGPYLRFEHNGYCLRVGQSITVNLDYNLEDDDVAALRYEYANEDDEVHSEMSVSSDNTSITVTGTTTGQDRIAVYHNGYPQYTYIYVVDDGVYDSGKSGDLEWVVELNDDNDFVLTITGSGEMTERPWAEYLNQGISKVVIGEGITTLADYAFYECTDLTNIELPSTLTSIGTYCFYNCQKLSGIDIPESVTSIGVAAFAQSGIESIVIPSGVTRIEYNTFNGCYKLAHVELPSDLTDIETYAFKYCNSLTSIDLPSGLFYIESYAFSQSGLTSVEIPSRVGKIGTGAFSSASNLQSVKINRGLSYIPDYCFDGCKKLTSVQLPDSIVVIEDYAFCLCTSLSSIEIPESVRRIGKKVFSSCDALTDIEIPVGVTNIGVQIFAECDLLNCVEIPSSVTSIGGTVVNNSIIPYSTNVVGGYVFEENTLTITDGTSSIIEGEFERYGAIKNIIIPKSVSEIGDNAFHKCKDLTDIYYEGSMSEWDDVTKGSNNRFDDVTMHFNSDGPSAPVREGTSGDVNWTLEEGVLTLTGTLNDSYMADYTSSESPWTDYIPRIKKVVVGDNVRNIGAYAFKDCYNVEEVVLSPDVYTIDDFAFAECQSLKKVVFEDSSKTAVTKYGFASFMNCKALEQMDISKRVEIIDDFAFYNCQKLAPSNMDSLPGTLEEIGQGAFWNCQSITRVVLPYSITRIGGGYSGGTGVYDWSIRTFDSADVACNYDDIEGKWGAFTGCTGLTSVKFVNYLIDEENGEEIRGVNSIEDFAFYGCTSLGELTLPESLSEMGKYTFAGCTGLVNVYIEDGGLQELYGTFEMCTSLTKVVFGTYETGLWNEEEKTGYWSSVQKIGDRTFNDCSALKEVVLTPELFNWKYYDETDKRTWTVIGDNAFRGCSALERFDFPIDTLTIGNSAFRNDVRLNHVVLAETTEELGSNAFYNDMAMEDFYIPVSVTRIGADCFYAREGVSSMRLMDLYYGGTKEEWDSLAANGISMGNELITADANSQYKANRHYNTDLDYPVVENVSAVYDQEEGEMTIQWDPVQWNWNGRNIDPTYYAVYVNNVKGVELDEQWETVSPTWKVIGKTTVNSLTWTMDEAEAGDIYNYRIRAYFGDDGAYLSSYTSTIIPENVNTLTWDFDEETGELHIIAEGSNVEIKDYIHADGFRAPWYAEREKIKSIRFSGNLVRIGNNAFRDCTSLRNVILPETIQSIGEYAFYNDKALESIYLPKTLQTIGTGCFSCDGMEAAMRLMDLYYGGSESDWASVIIGDYNGLIRTTGDDDYKLTIYYETDPSCPAASNVDTIFEDNTIKISWDEVTRQVSGISVSPTRYMVYMNHSGQDSIETQWSDGTPEWTLIASTTKNSLSYQIDIPIRDDIYRFRVMEVFGDYHGLMTDYAECKIPSQVSVIAAGTCGENLTWTMDDEGLLTISGNGEMDDYEMNSSPWQQYKEQISSVIIKKGVTNIGDFAFYGCSNLVYVDMPSGVLGIGTYAFAMCESLTDIDLPMSITRIEGIAFSGCNSLRTINIPSGMKEIEDWAFSGCEGLESIEIPEGVTIIGEHAFWCCSNLKSVKISSTVTNIGTSAFDACSKLTDIQIPSGVKAIGRCVFAGCSSLSTVKVPENVIKIDGNVFRNGIIEVSEEETAMYTYIYAHLGAIKGVAIPVSVTEIRKEAFYECSDLTDIYYAGTQEQWNEINKSGDDWLTGITIHFNSSAPSEEDIENKRAASAVEAEIDAIGTVEYTEACLAKINAARTAYDALNAEQKALVGNYTALTDAEAAYAKLDANNADKKAAAAVEETIKAIGTVEYTEESKAKIDAARTAYDKLTETQQKLVSNIATLTAAEEEYTRLKEAAEQDEEKKAISAVEEAITAIGTVEYTEECKAKIDEARMVYDQLTDAQKEQVTNLEVLTAAEGAYAELKAAAEKEVISSVEDAISAIGTVAYTEESKALIDAARTAYDALSDEQKEQVTNLEVLTKAEEEYANLQAAAGQDAADKEAAAAVVNAIKGIGTVANTDESKSKIDAARTAYDQLTDAQKKLVTNLNVLTDAEDEYARLKSIPAKGTALVENKNGEKVYYKDGQAQTNYSGLAENNGSWYYVEKGVLAENKRGYVDFDGSKFLVVDGKLENTANGLVQDPDHPEDWYFLSGGQAQTQYTGLVQYDGEWFYVNKGGLDTNLAAYVEYDGGLFFVAAGRILTEVNGLAQDPNGGDWYYLANGQVQTQYTGLAQYDGEWFYVQKGRLAVEYITLVDYDGSTFCSVYGMIKDFDSLNETDAVIALCNNERRTRDLPLMEKGEELTAAAQARSGELPESFAHQRPNGESCFTMLDVYGVKYNWAAENIAYGQNTAQIVVEDWMNSDGHRANILNEKCRHIGVGKILAENGRIYWTQMFTD